MITELALSKLVDIVVSIAGTAVNRIKSDKEWEKIFVNTGHFFCEYEKNAESIFDDLTIALSSENMKKFAEELKVENGYELKDKLFDYILCLLHKYEIPEDIALSYATRITSAILNGT